MKITVLGDGSFGTALAQTLAHKGHSITLWCYDPEIASAIEQARCNIRYLPDLKLHANITPITSLEEALTTADPSWIVEAIPVAYMRSVLSQTQSYVTATPWVIASKGIEAKTNLLPSPILTESLGKEVPIVVLSGPSFARQLAEGMPTGLSLASTDLSLATSFKRVIESTTVVVDTTQDIIGTQLCGALKNVIALTLGIIDGAGYETNTQALVFTKMVKELEQLIKKHNGDTNTLLTFAGIGDLTMTAYSSQSRNKTLGKSIGKQEYKDKELPYTEGINTLTSIPAITMDLSVPIFTAVYKVVFDQQPADVLITACIKK